MQSITLKSRSWILQVFQHCSVSAIVHHIHPVLPTLLHHHCERSQKIWAFLNKGKLFNSELGFHSDNAEALGREEFLISFFPLQLKLYNRRGDSKVSSAKTLGETANIARELVADSSIYIIFSSERHSLKKWSASRNMQGVEQMSKPLLTQLHHEQKGSECVVRFPWAGSQPHKQPQLAGRVLVLLPLMLHLLRK